MDGNRPKTIPILFCKSNISILQSSDFVNHNFIEFQNDDVLLMMTAKLCALQYLKMEKWLKNTCDFLKC